MYRFIILLFLAATLIADNEPIKRDRYLRYIPIKDLRAVSKTVAADMFRIYGDPSSTDFIDKAPVDGIDDRAADRLMKLSVKFSPLMIQNTSLLPMNVTKFWSEDPSFKLHIDTWDIIDKAKTLKRSEEVSLNINSPEDAATIKKYLHQYRPDNPHLPSMQHLVKRKEFSIFFINLPGHNPKTWRKAFKDSNTDALKTRYRKYAGIFSHPFVIEIPPGTKSPERFEFVIQYWFYYPYNSGGNNHEGDWEHINVVVSPVDKVTGYLTAEGVRKLINPGSSETEDSKLVIKRVEYYFHGKVMGLDYSSPNAYSSDTDWKKEVRKKRKKYKGISWIWKKIRDRAWQNREKTIVNTHPVVFIGGDSKGFVQLITAPGNNGRDSHGSYPFSGYYKGFGPMGAGEKIASRFDHRRYFRKLAKGKNTANTKFKRGSLQTFMTRDRITLLPHWEVVSAQVMQNEDIMKKWAWMVLPLTWGYPASPSPAAGLIPHTDMGNLGPVGPNYNGGWNHVIHKSRSSYYNPHTLAPFFPLEWQDNFDNRLGFLNLTAPTLINLPPFNLVWGLVVKPVKKLFSPSSSVFYHKANLPKRHFSISIGASSMSLPSAMSHLILEPGPVSEINRGLASHFSPSELEQNLNEVLDMKEANGFNISVSFYFGNRIVTENTLSHYKTDFNYTITAPDNPSPYKFGARLNFWEYSGSVRYNIFTGRVQPFVKLGYGLSWYRAEKIHINGKRIENSNSTWIGRPDFRRLKTFLPNTLHYGIGLEYISVRGNAGGTGNLDLSIKAEYIVYSHKFGMSGAFEFGLIPLKIGDFRIKRNVFNLGISFGI